MSNVTLSNSYFKGNEERPLTDLTIGQYFDSIAGKYPNHDAIVVKHQNIHWTYAQYQARIKRVASALVAMGVEKGDRVAIWSPNKIEWSLVQMATARIGAIMVCINPAYRPHELAFALNNVSVKYLVMAEQFKASNYVEMINELAPELAHDEAELSAEQLPHLKQVILISSARQPGMMTFDGMLSKANDESELKAQQLADSLDTHDDINIQFTSGTTGNPKGATLSHHNILNNGIITAQAMHLGEQDTLCIPVPLYHCFGMVLGNLVCVAVGACAVFPALSFDPISTLSAVEQYKCTALHGVPTMFIAQLEHPEFSRFDLSTLRTGVMAGATCPEELMRKVHSEFHMREVVIGYGQTECSPINHITEIDSPIDKQVKTVGRAMAHTEVKIVNEQGDIAPIGTPGEICAKGYCVMQGYWNDDAKTKATIDEQGWLHSGDLGVMDSEGYVTIVGRIKDMIIRGGENIYPREIEEVLYLHPDVSDAAVFGIPDQKYGEQVCLWLKEKDGHSLDEQSVRDYLKDKLAYFKIPKIIRIVEDYPMTVTGKLQKFKMRDLMVKELQEQDQSA